ncbi:VPDSG-CTERM sorting domain-containing protein [Oleiharenicola lentus]|jgi:hypothetical protein|uniref:VPDSG-CTERM sorting domain-containing protein n=1 Tax=Oleiharenicola lentus TaxID=2508720 RepID=A0A4Q1C357_9BACT|nr:VPDSG-CTERM sorting domain-containing protein [Oleiharenicola lentus]RXK52818.1 VPDSG-CTERM sorting domain-containing protein [Oleiharenicola lentus]
MKHRLIAVLVLASLAVNQLHAVQWPPSVPDSGGTIGFLALGLLAVIALRRKLTK